jgi:hypothetical protein
MRVKQGQGYRIQTTVEQRNLDGTYTKVDPTTIVGTLLLPDQTTTPFTPSKDAVGEYHADLSPTLLAAQTGPYQWKVITTGPGAGEQDGSFEVVDPFAAELLSVEDGRAVLNLVGDSQDAELEVYVAAVTEAIEDDIGPVGRRTVTETVYPENGILFLKVKPVLSITSVTPYLGIALGSSAYMLTPAGNIYPAAYSTGFYAAYYTVVYVAGRTSVQAKVNLAARMVLKHLWSFQQGPSATIRAGFGPDNSELTSEAFAYVKSYGVQDLLKREKLAPSSP